MTRFMCEREKSMNNECVKSLAGSAGDLDPEAHPREKWPPPLVVRPNREFGRVYVYGVPMGHKLLLA